MSPCAMDCQDCSFAGAGKCNDCAAGFALAEDLRCVPCPSHCDRCSAPHICDACAPRYRPLLAGASCARCADPNCVDCSGHGCSRCDTGYGLVNGTCRPCGVEHCDDCDARTCLRCAGGRGVAANGAGPAGTIATHARRPTPASSGTAR